MTSIGDAAETFGPYHFTLSPAEREAAAARFGLRSALRGRLIANQLAPLTAFVLVLLFASILALTGSSADASARRSSSSPPWLT